MFRQDDRVDNVNNAVAALDVCRNNFSAVDRNPSITNTDQYVLSETVSSKRKRLTSFASNFPLATVPDFRFLIVLFKIYKTLKCLLMLSSRNMDWIQNPSKY